MNIEKILILILIFSLNLRCVNKSEITPNLKTNRSYANDTELIDWYHLSPNDSLSGIALERAHEYLKNKGEGEEVVVAVIDSEVDINHEDLIESIYVNSKEIPNNGIDDDNNGYVDDLHGWNYLGRNDGGSVYLGNPQYIRTLRRLVEKYDILDLDNYQPNNPQEKSVLNKALEDWDAGIKSGQRMIDWSENLRNNYFEAQKRYPKIFIDEQYTDSIIQHFKPEGQDEEKLLGNIKYWWNLRLSLEDISMVIEDGYGQKNVSNNIYYDPFLEVDPKPKMISYNGYGHGQVHVNAHHNKHGTQVSGSIAATRNNQLGIKGFSNNIKIMVLAIEPYGNFRDKDFVNAVHYAVDNGAKVINLSTGKLEKELENKNAFIEAIEYATEKGVIFVASSGNRALNIDLTENQYYPTGNSSVIQDRLKSFIKVGASGKKTDSTFRCSFSNYGKENVDVFAPGINMTVTNGTHRGYFTLGGTSLSAALTSGLSALILSHFPNLSADEVKTIILDSSTKYDMEVDIPDGKRNFNELSRSGGVINAYNAIKMAEEISEKKK